MHHTHKLLGSTCSKWKLLSCLLKFEFTKRIRIRHSGSHFSESTQAASNAVVCGFYFENRTLDSPRGHLSLSVFLFSFSERSSEQ